MKGKFFPLSFREEKNPLHVAKLLGREHNGEAPSRLPSHAGSKYADPPGYLP